MFRSRTSGPLTACAAPGGHATGKQVTAPVLPATSARMGVGLFAALLLAACAQPSGLKIGSTIVGVQVPKPAQAIVVAAKPAAAAPEPTPVSIWHDAGQLVGMTPDALTAALGKPARIRDEESGRIYQYVGNGCVIDLFLYRSDAGGYHVTYAEARSGTAQILAVDACLKSLPTPVVADSGSQSGG